MIICYNNSNVRSDSQFKYHTNYSYSGIEFRQAGWDKGRYPTQSLTEPVIRATVIHDDRSPINVAK